METDHTLYILQNYWWLIISVLGALLVFLLFVQGGQSLIMCTRDADRRNLMLNAIGTKWELTFTTLVVFGGAFFASFPLFYSTSFGGAYWLWILILFTFVGQAVSYQYRRKKGNIYGTGFFDLLLVINGTLGCFLLGEAVSMMFFGGDFTVKFGNILDSQAPVISEWGKGHGFESIFCWRNWILGLAVVFLARMQATLYFMNAIRVPGDKGDFLRFCKRHALVSGLLFVIFFVAFLVMILTKTGLTTTGTHSFAETPHKIFDNYIEMWWCAVILLLGVVAVLYGWGRSVFTPEYRKGIWFTGIGTILAVLTLFWVVGYNNTPYYPSLTDIDSSLTIRNSSSTLFTLKVMSWVSILVPFVVAYIWVVWRKLNAKPVTPAEVEGDSHSY